MLSSHINHHQLQSEHVSHSFFVFYQMLNVKIAMLIFIKWNEVNRRNKFSLSKSFFPSWKCYIRRNVNLDISIVTMRRVAIIFFEQGAVKYFMQIFLSQDTS